MSAMEAECAVEALVENVIFEASARIESDVDWDMHQKVQQRVEPDMIVVQFRAPEELDQ
jgi:hypothetical protein